MSNTSKWGRTAKPSRMKANGLLVFEGGYNTSTLGGGTKNVKGKQQYCYLCKTSHPYHPFEEG